MRTVLVVAASLVMRQASEPLTAQFLPPESPSSSARELRYSLNDRAYVAIFVILPGRGVGLLYPFNLPSTQEGRGDHVVPLQSADIRQQQRAAALLIPEREHADGAYLFLVASRQPLRLAPYVSRQVAIDSALGPAVQRTVSLDAITASLANLVVNVSTAGDFASDLDQARRVIERR